MGIYCLILELTQYHLSEPSISSS